MVPAQGLGSSVGGFETFDTDENIAYSAHVEMAATEDFVVSTDNPTAMKLELNTASPAEYDDISLASRLTAQSGRFDGRFENPVATEDVTTTDENIQTEYGFSSLTTRLAAQIKGSVDNTTAINTHKKVAINDGMKVAENGPHDPNQIDTRQIMTHPTECDDVSTLSSRLATQIASSTEKSNATEAVSTVDDIPFQEISHREGSL